MGITKKPIKFYLISFGQKLSKIKLRFPKNRRKENGIRPPVLKDSYKVYLGVLFLVVVVAFATYRLMPLREMQNSFSMTGEGYDDFLDLSSDAEEEDSEGLPAVAEKESWEEDYVLLGEEIPVNIIDSDLPEEVKPAPQEVSGGTTEILTAPLEAEVSLPFGLQYNSVFKDWRWHPGLDYQLPEGEEIKAALSGKVSKIIDHEYYGWLVIIEHGNGKETRYGHCKNVKLAQGKSVKQGEVIGEVGMTGLAEAPHLHWELWLKGEPVDPQKYLGKKI